jgi:hypothetical protein
MKPERQTEVLEKNLARNLAWISAADARVAPLFAINTAMLGVVAALLPRPAMWEKLPLVVAVLAVICLGASLVCIFLTTIPRTTGPKGSLLFFGGITQKDAEQYHQAMKEQKDDDYLKDLAHQVHRNAEIATDKFKWIGRAMRWTLIGSLPWLATTFLLYQRH